jgi:ABC-2 type transport system permease protein
MSFFRVVKAEVRKYYVQQFVSYRTAFWFLILPFGNGLLYYSMYLPFTSGFVSLSWLGRNNSVDIVGFTLLGQLLFTFFVGVTLAGSAFDTERMQGTFEAMLLTPASRVAILVGGLATAAAQYLWLIIGIIPVFLFFFRLPIILVDPFALLLSLLLTYLSLVALGLCLEAYFIHTRRGILLGTLLQEPIALGAGVIVPSTSFPTFIALITYLIPLTLGLVSVRLTLLAGGMLSDVAVPLTILGVMTVVFLFLGRWLIARAEASAKANGTLGLF